MQFQPFQTRRHDTKLVKLYKLLPVAEILDTYVKSSYIVHYPVLGTAQTTSHFNSLGWQTYSIKHHLKFFRKHPSTLQLMRKGCSYIYCRLSTLTRFTQLSELEQCRVTSCPMFLTAAQDSNPGSRALSSTHELQAKYNDKYKKSRYAAEKVRPNTGTSVMKMLPPTTLKTSGNT